MLNLGGYAGKVVYLYNISFQFLASCFFSKFHFYPIVLHFDDDDYPIVIQACGTLECAKNGITQANIHS